MLTLGRERPVMEPPAMEEEVVGGGLQAMADDDEDIDQYNDDTFGAGATDEDWEPSQDSPLLSLPTLYNPPPHHHHNNHNNHNNHHHHPHHPHHHHPCDDPWPHESSLLLLLPPCSSPGGVGVGVGCEGDEGDDGEGGEADERANDSLAESGFEDSISKLVLEDDMEDPADDMEDPAVIRAGVRRPLTEDSAIVDSLCSMSSWRGLMNRSLTPPPPLQPSIWGSPPAHVMSQLTHSLPPSHVDHSLFHAMECGVGGGGVGGGGGWRWWWWRWWCSTPHGGGAGEEFGGGPSCPPTETAPGLRDPPHVPPPTTTVAAAAAAADAAAAASASRSACDASTSPSAAAAAAPWACNALRWQGLSHTRPWYTGLPTLPAGVCPAAEKRGPAEAWPGGPLESQPLYPPGPPTGPPTWPPTGPPTGPAGKSRGPPPTGWRGARAPHSVASAGAATDAPAPLLRRRPPSRPAAHSTRTEPQ
ncbi:unnamed protein product, partial [Lampetra planeri]